MASVRARWLDGQRRRLGSRWRAIPGVLAVLAFAGCSAPAGSAPRPDDPITADELRSIVATTVLTAVRELRPQWLTRLEGAFLDGNPVSVRHLEEESLSGIAEIRLLTAEQATARYGTRSLSGSFLEVVRRW